MSATLPNQLSFSTYTSKAGRYDECRLPDGSIRPQWSNVSQLVERLGLEGLEERAGQIEQLIRENGLTFQVDTRQSFAAGSATPTDTEPSRPWQLATLPVAFSEADWQPLADGLSQRVRVLEAVLADLLGPQRLVKERILPSELLWGNPRFYRAYHQLAGQNPTAQRLHLTAFDVVRGDDGAWWVTGDRTRAPSGLGYLLENRIVLSRVFPHLHRRANVRRLAPFFEAVQSHFRSLAPRAQENPRIGLLTPGPGSYREFEDAYLARYLGYTLVQGRDLAVRGDRLNLKTLGGLLPIEVLWRHVSDRKCDPLELDPNSLQGCTGLLRMIRDDQISVVNSIGTAIVEMPALLPFLRAAAKLLLGEELKLPSVATYWCGDKGPRQHVLDHLDDLIIRNAYAVNDAQTFTPSQMSAAEKQDLIAKIKSNPADYVAQQRLSHSLTPVWQSDEMRPWNLTLRSFQLQTDKGIEVLPGGLARVSPQPDLLGKSPTSGQLTQDCWVVSDSPVDHEATLLSSDSETIQLRRGGDELPSRVAEHLFWLGRYVERCECIARLMRTTLTRLAGEDEFGELPEMPRLVTALAAMGQIEPDYAIEGLDGSMPQLDLTLPASVFDTSTTRGLQDSAVGALRNATAVRDRISLDAYRIFRSLHHELVVQDRPRGGNMLIAIERLNHAITHLLAFSGLSAESLTRTHGWRFVLLGRRIERAFQTAELLLAALSQPMQDETAICEATLDATDSLMTYRSRYLSLVRVAPTIDLLVTDESNPRSLHFQLQDIEKLLRRLPTDPSHVGLGTDERLAADLLHELLIADVNELTHANEKGERQGLTDLLGKIVSKIPQLARAVEARYLIHTSQQQVLIGEPSSVSLEENLGE